MEKKHGSHIIRVSQSHEPEHFLKIFSEANSKAKLRVSVESQKMESKNSLSLHEIESPSPQFVIIRKGNSESFSDHDKVLYHVSGQSVTQVLVVQTVWNPCCFNSGSCFIVCFKNIIYVWVGQGAFSFEKEAAVMAAYRISVSFQTCLIFPFHE